MNQWKYVFSQLTEFVPRYAFDTCVEKYSGNKRCKSLTCWEQFLAMSFWQVTWQESLRSLVVCLNAHANKLYHLWFRNQQLAKSTLFEANEKRDWRIYQDFAHILIQQVTRLHKISSEKERNEFKEISGSIYALDSTTIDVCLHVFEWAHFRKTKWAIKLHTLMDIRWSIPKVINITHGKCHDVYMLDELDYEAWSFYIFDRAYIDFQRFSSIDEDGAFFVTRAKRNIQYHRLYSHRVDKTTWVRCDQTIQLTWLEPYKHYQNKLRRVKYYDSKQNKTYVFITNNFILKPDIIAELYRRRWKIETFFRWIKQNLKIKRFWWHSENAVKLQVWIAICIYLVVIIMKHQLKTWHSIYEILQILSVSVFDKTSLKTLFDKYNYKNLEDVPQEQLQLRVF